MTWRASILGIRHVVGYLQLLALTIYSLGRAADVDMVLVERSRWTTYAEIYLLNDVQWSLPPVLRPRRVDVFLEHRSFNYTDHFPCNSTVFLGPGNSSPSRFCAVMAAKIPMGNEIWMERLVGYFGGEYRFRFMWEDKDVGEDGNVSVTSMVGYADIPLVSYLSSLPSWDVIDTQEKLDMASKGTKESVSLSI